MKGLIEYSKYVGDIFIESWTTQEVIKNESHYGHMLRKNPFKKCPHATRREEEVRKRCKEDPENLVRLYITPEQRNEIETFLILDALKK